MSQTPNNRSTSEFINLSTPPQTEGQSDGLSETAVANLLSMGVSGQQRPLDRLLERMTGGASATWMLDLLRQPPIQVGPDIEASLVRGKVGLAGLDQIKERCKLAALTNTDANTRLAATGGYYLAIASAALNFRRLITSQPREEVGAALADLSTAMPEPWSTFLARAALEVGVA